MNIKANIAILFCLFSLTQMLPGNSLFKDIYLENRFHYGFVFPHHTSIDFAIRKHVPAFEIVYSIPTYGKHAWEEKYRYPRKGFGIFHANLMNRSVLGSVTGVYSFMNISLWDTRYMNMSYRVNAGLSYLNRIFDEQTNLLNTAIGSHFNMYFRLGLDIRGKINNRYECVLETGLTHFSNGNLDAPNLGLNLITCSGGIIYYIGNHPKKRTIPEMPDITKKYEFSFFIANGARTYFDFVDTYFYKSTLSLSFGRFLNIKRFVGIGTDIFYDGSSKPRFERDNFTDYTFSDLMQVGIFGFHDLVYKKFSFSIQLGYYVYKKNEHIFDLYNRTGLKYKLSKNIVGIIALKSHKTQADYIELGIGMYL